LTSKFREDFRAQQEDTIRAKGRHKVERENESGSTARALTEADWIKASVIQRLWLARREHKLPGYIIIDHDYQDLLARFILIKRNESSTCPSILTLFTFKVERLRSGLRACSELLANSFLISILILGKKIS